MITFLSNDFIEKSSLILLDKNMILNEFLKIKFIIIFYMWILCSARLNHLCEYINIVS